MFVFFGDFVSSLDAARVGLLVLIAGNLEGIARQEKEVFSIMFHEERRKVYIVHLGASSSGVFS